MKKGEVSGNVQKIKTINIDCDNDTLLITVDEENDFCHVGQKSCFYQNLKSNL